MADELDALVLEGHGGALNPEAGDGTEDFERRHAALQDRLKCDVITVAEEVAKEKACRVSPQFAQCLAELTMTYALGLADDVHAFAQALVSGASSKDIEDVTATTPIAIEWEALRGADLAPSQEAKVT